MLHVAFQNIKGLPHFGVRWGVSSTHSLPSESTSIAWSCLANFSLLEQQLLECPSQCTSILHTLPFAYPFSRFNDNYLRSHPWLQNGRPSKRGLEKSRNSWDVWGESGS
ncbi:hypothetical protein AVEN_268122-1 [Araneus ventricosus]|uniref:Uncharacterized protein n=1 Tax=Araneus ventricosus TaxID=182803 RepID=A0A4Y2D0V2_ARAVE|nr:hypothetical protein AVEN_268122-1 [Araneus ventricosus]